MTMPHDPYTVPYQGIYAICNRDQVEIIEHTNCYGGACWAKHHFSRSPLVREVKVTGDKIRYLAQTGSSNPNLQASNFAAAIQAVEIRGDTVEITYTGLGGGGIGATTCRAGASGVLESRVTPAGGGRKATGTIILPRRERVIVGIDDTDTKEKGATWSLAHNIAVEMDSPECKYISHALVQLYPVPARTQNCVSTVLEFACTKKSKEKLLRGIKTLLETYTVSSETGMVVLAAFQPPQLLWDYSHRCRTDRVNRELALETACEIEVEVWLDGQGVIGALAALPWYARPEDAVKAARA